MQLCAVDHDCYTANSNRSVATLPPTGAGSVADRSANCLLTFTQRRSCILSQLTLRGCDHSKPVPWASITRPTQTHATIAPATHPQFCLWPRSCGTNSAHAPHDQAGPKGTTHIITARKGPTVQHSMIPKGGNQGIQKNQNTTGQQDMPTWPCTDSPSATQTPNSTNTPTQLGRLPELDGLQLLLNLQHSAHLGRQQYVSGTLAEK
jgi:hypothetical protein